MPVSTACLVIESDSPSGEGSAAFLPVAGMALIERVVQRLVSAGIEQLIVKAPSPWPVLKRLAQDMKRRGAAMQIVANAGDLADYVRADQSFLLIQDGVLPSRKLVEDAIGRRDAVLYTRPVASSDERHERIDLSDRWAGVAILPGSLAHDLDDHPADWSLSSALLRRAVQHSVIRSPLDIGRGAERRADMLLGKADCASAEQRLIDEHFDGSTNSWPGLLSSTGKLLSRNILPTIWRRRVEGSRIGLGLIIAAALAVILALSGLPALALIVGMAVLLGHELFRHHLAFVAGRNGRTESETGLLVMLMLSISAPVATIATHGPTITAISAGVLLPLLLFASARFDSGAERRLWRFDALSASLLLLLMLILGVDPVAAVLGVSVAVLAAAMLPALRDAVKAALTQKG